MANKGACVYFSTQCDCSLFLSSELATYLSPKDLLAVSLTCRSFQSRFALPLERRVSLDGPNEILNFIEAALDEDGTEWGPLCTYGHAMKRKSCQHRKEEQQSSSSSSSRFSHIQHLEMQEPGPVMINFALECFKIEERLLSHRKLASSLLPGGLIGTAIRLVPALTSLHVYQSSLALTPALAMCIAAWTPSLQSFHFHSAHTDATSLAFVIENCPDLVDLDVSGVKSCRCNCHNARKGVTDLAAAIANSKLRRVVIRASRTASEEEGLLLHLLAQSKTWSTLESLELHRISVPGSALVQFLHSPASASLSHLFLGGMRKVRPNHLLVQGKTCRSSSNSTSGSNQGFFSATTAVRLEIDAYLLSTELLQRIGSRITLLRVYQPRKEQIVEAIKGEDLPRLAKLIILPSDNDSCDWNPARPLGETLETSIKRYRPHLDVQIGDEPWQAIQTLKAALFKYEAQRRREESREVQEKEKYKMIAALGGAAYQGGLLIVE